MATSGLQVKNHPVHPMIVMFPIAFWIGALIGDVAYLATGSFFWYSFAFVSMGFGLILGAVAAVAGAVDYFSLEGHTRAKQVGTIHGLLNLGVLAIFLINFMFRAGAGPVFAVPPEVALAGSALWASFLLTIFGVLLLSISAWLGAELVYVEGAGVQRRKKAAGLDLPEEETKTEYPERGAPRPAAPHREPGKGASSQTGPSGPEDRGPGTPPH